MDIVERLRLTDLQLAQEAADEIERLLAHAVKMRLVCEELAARLGAGIRCADGGSQLAASLLGDTEG